MTSRSHGRPAVSLRAWAAAAFVGTSVGSATRSVEGWLRQWVQQCGSVVGRGPPGENLLVHGGTGEVMHVDFSCLFDRGLTLNEPERVPFRLTQNLIDCFGVSGHEGAFRRCCEATLQVWSPPRFRAPSNSG